MLLPFGPTLVEQPIAPGQLDQLARVTASVPVSIVADEDANTADDVARLVGVVAHLASLADYLDLDGHFDVVGDAWAGIGGRAAVLRLSDAPGLGVHRRRAGA
jgi:L-alanine-DL-glutamate epimerase-like enolase superfamily enzyme